MSKADGVETISIGRDDGKQERDFPPKWNGEGQWHQVSDLPAFKEKLLIQIAMKN